MSVMRTVKMRLLCCCCSVKSHLTLCNTAWTAACQVSCPSLSPWVCSNPCPLSQWHHPTISSSVTSYSSCPQSFPASGSFQMSRLFPSCGQSTGASASASVLPMNIQGWFSLGLTDLISVQSKGLSRVFPIPQFESNNSDISLLYGPPLTSIRDHCKNHSFDQMDLCQQGDVSAF